MDLHHIYGDTLERQHKLRLFKDGKLKYQVSCYTQTHTLTHAPHTQRRTHTHAPHTHTHTCHTYTNTPLTHKCVCVQVLEGEVYPPTVRDVGVYMHYPPYVPEEHRFAVGHEVFGLVPGLMMYATLWLREHNRVCDIMRAEHPDWDDERLFQTSRLILTGQSLLRV